LFKHYKKQCKQKIAIVGSGLVGSLLAIYLRKAGHTVHLYDRSPDIRFSSRTFNKFSNVKQGLESASMVLGYRIPFTKSQYPWTSVLFNLVDKLNFQNYGQEGESIYSISEGR
jgi:kynurenine 3-monooxygenase